MKHNFYIKALTIALIILFVGFLRDYLFYNINAHIHFLEWYHINYCEPLVYEVIQYFDVQQTNNLKWWLTVVFTEISFGVSMFGILLISKKPRSLIRVLSVLYIFLIATSALFYGLYHLTGVDFGYEISRFLMHILQSPIPFFILIPASYIKNNIKVVEQD